MAARHRFWLVDYFLRVCWTSYTYETCLQTPKETFDTIQSIIRHVQVATWSEKDIFVDFLKIILRNSQKFWDISGSNFFLEILKFSSVQKKVYKLSTNGLYFRGLPGDALQPTKRIRVITLTVSFVETHKDEQGKRLVKAVEPNLKSPN